MKVEFKFFLEKFPAAKLPIILSDESHHDFAKENDPLPPPIVQDFIIHYEPSEPDEFTEYIACFQIPTPKKDFKAIVYWKAGLLNYDYVVATYEGKTGVMIDKKAIAGTKVVGNAVKRIVATIFEDFSIVTAEGVEEKNVDYIADSSQTHRYEILENGRIEQDY